MGGALSNGGDVFAWMKRTLALPKDVEARLGSIATPGGHGLTLLPFFSGERSPYWRADLRGVIAGLTQSTQPFDILRASLESVALRFREIYEALAGAIRNAGGSRGVRRRAAQFTRVDADDGGRARTPADRLHGTRSVLPRRGDLGAGTDRPVAKHRIAARVLRGDVRAAPEYTATYDRAPGRSAQAVRKNL